MRLLAGAAEAVPALHDVEVETLVRIAAAPQPRRRTRHRFVPLLPPPLLLTAAAAVSVLAVVLPVRQHESERPPSSPRGIAAPTVSFPEGSALALLLTGPSERRA